MTAKPSMEQGCYVVGFVGADRRENKATHIPGEGFV